MGEITRKTGDLVEAVDFFKQAAAILPLQDVPWNDSNDHALFIEALAEVYFETGRSVEALEEYGKINSLTSGRIAYGDIYARSLLALQINRE